MTEAVEHMVQRFLTWKLPENFNPDAGISFKPTFNDHLPVPMRHNPTGTNLFDYVQAKAMVMHMLEGAPSDQGGWIVGNGDGTKWRTWGAMGPEWTTDRNTATRYYRREDAEAVHRDDEDAWTIVPFGDQAPQASTEAAWCDDTLPCARYTEALRARDERIAELERERDNLSELVRGWHYLAVGPDEMGDYHTQRKLIELSEPYASPALKALKEKNDVA